MTDYLVHLMACGFVGIAVRRFWVAWTFARKLKDPKDMQRIRDELDGQGADHARCCVSLVTTAEWRTVYRMLFYAVAVYAFWGWVR